MKLDREEFQKLALEQIDTLYRMARRFTGDETRAEDLVQETYLRALRAADGFDLQQYGIRPWLLRIMHNLHVSRGGRESRQPKSMDTDHLDSAARQAPYHGGDLPPINLGSFEAMDQALVAALEELPQEYKTVLMLWAVEEFSYKEIAETLAVPIGTVMSRLHRARQRLSAQLRPGVNEG
jgi:RNA polymerase sigma-70 factor (ECF subfamily)